MDDQLLNPVTCCQCSETIDSAPSALAVYADGTQDAETMYGCNNDAILIVCAQRGYPSSAVEWYQYSRGRECSNATAYPIGSSRHGYNNPQLQTYSGIATSSAQAPGNLPGASNITPYSRADFSHEPVKTQKSQSRTSSWKTKLSLGKRRQSDMGATDADPAIGQCLTCSSLVRESQRTLQLYRDVQVTGKRKTRIKREIALFDKSDCQEAALSTPGSHWTNGIVTAPPVDSMASLGAFERAPTPHEGETYPMNLAQLIPRDETDAMDLAALPGSYWGGGAGNESTG